MTYRCLRLLMLLGLTQLFLLSVFPGIPLTVAATAQHRPRIGLVLGGGGARGIAHVGVLKLLEEMRVPIDCIAGTSMGSIIGGLYAAGMSPTEMSETVQTIDWPKAFTDGPPRTELPFHIKQEQRVLLNAEVGFTQGQVLLPKGLLEGQNLLLLLEKLSLSAASIHDFDQLRIPYRAVATDLATGTPVVLGSGELAKAMRASMSIPSALAPVELDGRLLVDGGIAANVPIDVVRQLCHPDVIIAVSVGAPLASANQLTSVLSVTEQLTNFLTAGNTNQQLQTLRRKDVLIAPDLKDISSTAFNRAAEAIKVGYAAAEDKRDELMRLATTPAVYQAYLASLPALTPSEQQPVIDFIRIENDTRLSNEAITRQLHIKPGDRLDPDALHRNLNAIYGSGQFQRVNYTLVKEAGKTGLVVETKQRDIGTDTLKLGLFVGANLKGDSRFDIGIAYTLSELNALGGQWRNFAQIGGNVFLSSDFYQPLDEDRIFYINPYVKYRQYNLDLFNDIYAKSSSFRVDHSEVGVEVGKNLGNWGQLSFDLFYGTGRSELRLGQPSPYAGDFNTGGYALRWAVDTLDSLHFPTTGHQVNLTYHNAMTELGADHDFSSLNLELTHAYTWGNYSIIPRLRLAGKLSGESDIQDLFLLGGFLNLSGYQLGELSGQYAALGQIIYMYRLTDVSAAFTVPVFAGGSFEVGGTWNNYRDISLDSLVPAGSLFIGSDTVFGPLYIGAGYAEKGKASLYLMLGKLF